MAQALFDDHPIEHYLRESGEVPELMPGGLYEYSVQITDDGTSYVPTLLHNWIPRLFNTVQHVLKLTGLRKPSAASQFAERFKYVVISSPLLSASLSSSPGTRATTPTTPGHFDHPHTHLHITPPMPTPSVSHTASQFLTFSLACLVPATMAQGYYVSSVCFLAAVKLLVDGGMQLPASLKSNHGDDSWDTTLEGLEALVVANNAWDSVVSEALAVLESEEQAAVQPSSPVFASLPLRIALSTSLHTTQTQCDNVRQLLAALTSPLVLSHFLHMYGPPSPSRPPTPPKRTRPMSFTGSSSSYSRGSLNGRPSVLVPPDDPYTRARSSVSLRMPNAEKRSTWNGSYMSLAGGPSPRRSSRRGNLSTVFSLEDLKSPEVAAFPGPGLDKFTSAHTPPALDAVLEGAGGVDAGNEPFGVAALDMRRKRRSMRALMLNASSPPAFSTPPRQQVSNSSPLTSTVRSRVTSFNSNTSPSRQTHPLSLSNLHTALQGSLGARRFACAHLLALRFSDPGSQDQISDVGSDMDGEDESYWEDVRSVISLLTSSFEDESARLAEALVDTVRKHEKERDMLTDDESSLESTSVAPELVDSRRSSTLVPDPLTFSFAPMPSHLTRFAAHVDSITSALDDAREHLRECVASLREIGSKMPTAQLHSEDLDVTMGSPAVALQSYERLRRELGLALRECERGRGALLELVQQGTPDRIAEQEGDVETPVRHEEQVSSGESDKTLYNQDEDQELKDTHLTKDPEFDHDQADDDATSHLLLTASSGHLPPPGIEQVFETVAAAQTFTRERSRLTREERIRLAKARRDSQSVPLDSVREGWGPGGEVVRELKDVIWKVSEERRKLVERTSSVGPQPDVTRPP
ncbi:hypothetical protein K439DRAFT_1660278 [Ramaria rubella]|nr:hypothetical protein K439DRAFT_1660278 [Ramaria rubella]